MTSAGGSLLGPRRPSASERGFVSLVAANRLLVFAILVMSLLFGAVQISQSLQQGQLAFPATYDTNGYLSRSLHYLDALYRDGLVAFLREMAFDPPRSASTTLISLIGFALIGVKDWTPNAVQIAEVGVLLAVVASLTAMAPVVIRLSLLLCALCWPISGFLIVENRPDILWGLTAAAAVHLLLSPSGIAAHRMTLSGAGLLAGMALVCKTTILPVTAVLLGLAFVAWLALRWQLVRASPAASLRAARQFLLLAILIPLPFSVLALPDTLRYVTQVLLSPKADEFLLSATGSWLDEASFYITGPGGQLAIGPWRWVVTVVVPLALIIAVRRQETAAVIRGMAIAVVVAAAYLIIVIPQLKSPFFGTMFTFLLLFGMIRCLCSIVLDCRGALSVVAAFGIATVSLALFHFPSHYRPYGDNREVAKQARHWTQLVNDVVEAVANGPNSPARVYFTTIFQFLNPDTLQWINDKRGLSNSKFIAVLHPETATEYDQALDSATDVIVVDADVVTLPRLTPRQVHERQAAEVRDNPAFQRVRGFAGYDGRVVAHLYRRPAPFTGIDQESLGAASSMSEIETFGEDGYSRRRTFETPVRQTSQGLVQLDVDAAQGGRYVIDGSAAGQAVALDLSVDGNPFGTAKLSSDWTHLRFELDLSAGRHTLELRIGQTQPAASPAEKLSFRRFQFLAADRRNK